MVKNLRSRSGYTLVEVMASVAIIAVVASIGAALLTQTNRFFILTKDRADLQKEARGIMYIMTREIRQAQNASIVLARASGSEPYYSQITFTKEEGSSMTLYQNGNLLCMATNAAAFTLTSGGKLVCQTTTHGGHDTILSKDLRYLAFTFPRTDDMTIISVSMTLQTSSYGGLKKALHMASQQVQIMD